MGGAAFELTPESKSQLGLLLPSNWNMDHMEKIQNRVALPLLCYWSVTTCYLTTVAHLGQLFEPLIDLSVRLLS